MRIERIRIDAFGRLERFDTGAETLGDLVVVLGPNESGKSTLFGFLMTALYGFHPATRERNPHVPWGAEEASGRIQLTLAEGGCVEVERRLRAGPSAKLTEGGVTRELRNQPIPWAQHVPRGVFGEVFAITLADLAGLDQETWVHIQDRIVGAMGSSDLRPARAVADTLEREASEIWRPNRRGNQRLRRLQEEIRALRGRRQEALERDREIRRLVEERENVRVRLRELRQERQRHRVAVERIQSLLPLRRQLLRIDSLRAKGGPPEELRDLPPDPEATLAALEQERRRALDRLTSLEGELLDPDEILASFDASARELLDRGEEIARFVGLDAGVAPERRRVAELEAEIAEIDRELGAAAQHLLEGGWTEVLSGPVWAVSIALLKDRIARARAARLASVSRPRSSAVPVTGGAGSLVGIALLAWGLGGGPTWAAVAGAALATAGAISVWLLIRARLPADRGSTSTARGETEPQWSEKQVRDMLSEVPIRKEYLEAPDDTLANGLERLQELVAQRRERGRALLVAHERLAEVDGEGERLSASLGRNGAPNAEGLAVVLDRELRNAERLRDAASAAQRERRRLTREIQASRGSLATLETEIGTLSKALSVLGGGDPGRGATAARGRLEALRRADQLEDELARGHADLEDLAAQIEASERAGESWTRDETDLARRRAHIEELDASIEQLIAEAEALDRNAAHLRETETVDAVDGEIASLLEQESTLVRERDRKWVLARLVREADRRFREEHQPDLLRRASAHLAHLTGGRYDRLLVDETHADGLFQILGAGLPVPVALSPPVSTGTLEQAYLALRLAIVDHLDHGHEHLPLFIDEVFVNWDRERRGHGLDAIADLAPTRQLFVFTCHPETAAHLQAHGARLLQLERD
jgi:uncharacterized protein YhaN